jgi:hypothetical protein
LPSGVSGSGLALSSRRTDVERRHAVAYALAVTVFGGTAQLVVTWLIRVTGDPLSPAWYLNRLGNRRHRRDDEDEGDPRRRTGGLIPRLP